MMHSLSSKKKAIGVIGLGYVGLPLALEFAKHFRVVAFDIDQERVAMMQRGKDPSQELSACAFENKDIRFTANPTELASVGFYVVAVPTDITDGKVPNLDPIKKASSTVASTMQRGDYVVYESTVYPGCTEEVCIPIIEEATELRRVVDFKFGYSPERINPGDKEHTVATILKVTSGCDDESAEVIDAVYNKIITAGTYLAESVKVAEASKVIENTQRDLNISLMNELAIVFDRLDIDTEAVLKAAETKWNFVSLRPGLVGGHCIGVDPYYLLHKAREVGVEPEVIAAGRRVNDRMADWIAKKIIIGLSQTNKAPSSARILILGVTFKENVSDTRNTRVVDLVRELRNYHAEVEIVDPYVKSSDFEADYGLSLSVASGKYDVVVACVKHQEFLQYSRSYVESLLDVKGLIFDLKGMYHWGPELGDKYWKL